MRADRSNTSLSLAFSFVTYCRVCSWASFGMCHFVGAFPHPQRSSVWAFQGCGILFFRSTLALVESLSGRWKI